MKKSVLKVGADKIIIPVNRDFLKLAQIAIENENENDDNDDNNDDNDGFINDPFQTNVIELMRNATHALIDPTCSVKSVYCFKKRNIVF